MLNQIVKWYKYWKWTQLYKLGWGKLPYTICTKYGITQLHKGHLYNIYPSPRHNNLPTMYRYNGNGTFSDFRDESFIVPFSKVEMLKLINIPETPKVKE